MTFEELKAALEKAGIVPGCYTVYFRFIDGLPVDCFIPDGKPIQPGYEESLDTYWFWPTSWENEYLIRIIRQVQLSRVKK